jgi:hypothetical protein
MEASGCCESKCFLNKVLWAKGMCEDAQLGCGQKKGGLGGVGFTVYVDGWVAVRNLVDELDWTDRWGLRGLTEKFMLVEEFRRAYSEPKQRLLTRGKGSWRTRMFCPGMTARLCLFLDAFQACMIEMLASCLMVKKQGSE